MMDHLQSCLPAAELQVLQTRMHAYKESNRCSASSRKNKQGNIVRAASQPAIGLSHPTIPLPSQQAFPNPLPATPSSSTLQPPFPGNLSLSPTLGKRKRHSPDIMTPLSPEEFSSDFLRWFTACGISYNVASHPATKVFFKKYLPQYDVPDRQKLSGPLLQAEVGRVIAVRRRKLEGKSSTYTIDGWCQDWCRQGPSRNTQTNLRK